MKVLSLLLLLFSLYSTTLNAQDAEHPVLWTFTVEQTGVNAYTLKAKADLAAGFHIWALDPGGDGSLIPTSFSMDKEDVIRWKGAWKEEEKPIVHNLDFIKGAIRWHEGSVTFSRPFTTDVALPLSGEVHFQICNGASCFPPESKSFLLQVKK